MKTMSERAQTVQKTMSLRPNCKFEGCPVVETKPFHKGVYEKLLGRTAWRKRKEDEVYQRRLEERSSLIKLGMVVNLAQRMSEDADEPYLGTLEMCPGRLHCKGIAVKHKIYLEHGWIARGQEEAHLVNLHASPSLAGNRQSSSQSTLEITEEDYGALEPLPLPPPNSQARAEKAEECNSASDERKIT